MESKRSTYLCALSMLMNMLFVKSKWTAAKFSYILCRYWVLLVIPYVLSVYVNNYTMEQCEKVLKVLKLLIFRLKA
jgi:hypothetical protein